MNVKQGKYSYMLGIKSLAVTIHFQVLKPLNFIKIDLAFTLKLYVVFNIPSVTNEK